MNIMQVSRSFPDHEACIRHLETVRWRGKPTCPHCESSDVARKKENKLVGRWNCHDCKSSFNVLRGTLFQGTRIALQKWFLAIALIANAKKFLSSHQLARDLDMNVESAWYLMQRIRGEMQRQDTGICYKALSRRTKPSSVVSRAVSIRTKRKGNVDVAQRRWRFWVQSL